MNNHDFAEVWSAAHRERAAYIQLTFAAAVAFFGNIIRNGLETILEKQVSPGERVLARIKR